MENLSNLANALDYSDIIHLEFYVQEQLAKGKEICDLIIGDFDTQQFPMPDYLTAQIQQAYENKQNDYPPLEGVLSLRDEVAKQTKKRFNVSYNPDTEMLISGGARPLLYSAMLATVSAEDKVIYPVPSWNNMFYTTMCGGKHVPIETSEANQFLPTAEQLQAHISDARLITLCSPQNPNGSMFSKQQLGEICNMVVAENVRRRTINAKPLYVIYDQVYWMLTMQEVKHYHPASLCPDIKPYLIVVDAGTKAFAATGIRVGWATGPHEVIAKMQVIQEHIGAMAPTAEQLATAVLFQNEAYLQSYLAGFKEKILASMTVLHQGVQDMKGAGIAIDSFIPNAGIYMTLKIDAINMETPDGNVLENADKVSRYLIDSAGLALVPFASFGCRSKASQLWYRAAVCTISPSEIEAALPRLQSALLALTQSRLLLEA
ncbi:pyridoxal phosphate-dependent aminotransferase [Pseudoalteromonas piscicida]|uniref:pyridoxal phosphate-dependent aminotransferase n=1 Tax=Pseudoalteromonas piscicida TaxID=43662 RepID=UPI001C96945A|nr:pyridoxal phosphate-dependent aminotransferase [Pseudoalteromonas piscicida]QZO14991.1 pyridoxal phosphate-dependent aminotransferase [Pseudoalteromonas piscicida]